MHAVECTVDVTTCGMPNKLSAAQQRSEAPAHSLHLLL